MRLPHANGGHYMGTVINIGIDFHKDSYSLCSYSFATKQAFGQTKIASNSNLVG